MQPRNIPPSSEAQAVSSSEYSDNSIVLSAETILGAVNSSADVHLNRLKELRGYLSEILIEPLRNEDSYPIYGFAQFAARVLEQHRKKN